jgi:hypothetical protein
MQIRQHLAIAAAAALFMAAAPADAQYTPATDPSFKRITVTCGSTPNFNLAQGTAFQLTLCGNAASTMSNASSQDGKIVSFLICQPVGTTSYTFAFPALVYGGSAIDARTGRCSAQAFLVASSQLWALAQGTNATTIPPPTLANPPLSNFSFVNAGGFTATNTTDDVTFSNTLGDTNFKNFIEPSATAKAKLTQPWTAQISFWLENPAAGAVNAFGIGMIQNVTDPAGKRAFCGYEYQAGSINRGDNSMWFANFGDGTNGSITAATEASNGYQQTVSTGTTFLANTSNVIVKFGSTSSDGAIKGGLGGGFCKISFDSGATFNDITQPGTSPNWGIPLGPEPGNGSFFWGVVGLLPSTSAKAHLTSISFTNP